MIEGNTKIYFNADFDSGNLENVEQLSSYVVYDVFMCSTNCLQDTIKLKCRRRKLISILRCLDFKCVW